MTAPDHLLEMNVAIEKVIDASARVVSRSWPVLSASLAWDDLLTAVARSAGRIGVHPLLNRVAVPRSALGHTLLLKGLNDCAAALRAALGGVPVGREAIRLTHAMVHVLLWCNEHEQAHAVARWWAAALSPADAEAFRVAIIDLRYAEEVWPHWDGDLDDVVAKLETRIAPLGPDQASPTVWKRQRPVVSSGRWKEFDPAEVNRAVGRDSWSAQRRADELCVLVLSGIGNEKVSRHAVVLAAIDLQVGCGFEMEAWFPHLQTTKAAKGHREAEGHKPRLTKWPEQPSKAEG